MKISTATGTDYVYFDTTNARVGIKALSPSSTLHIADGVLLQTYGSNSTPATLGGAEVGGDINGLYVSGKYAYFGNDPIAGTCSGTTLTGCEFRIYDISNPSSPTAVGGLAITDDTSAAVIGVVISGKYAYLGVTLGSGLNVTGNDFRIVDISRRHF
ncbi:MAG: hypothetical protein HYW00_00140 [Candidatus Colwellbacteria bacterium]|nr:hypothetical protein [Candidatus Colwellbacteria bacterium]